MHADARYILIIGEGINLLDASAEEVLRHLVARPSSSKVATVFSGLEKQIPEVMYRAHLFDHIGRDNIFPTEDMAIADIYECCVRIGE